MKNTQYKKILGYLHTHKTISPMEAFSEFYITKLATRISEMRKMGYEFIKTNVTYTKEDGTTVTYKQYELVSEPGVKA